MFSMTIAQNMIICVRSRQAQHSEQRSRDSAAECDLMNTYYHPFGQCGVRRARELQLVKIHLKNYEETQRDGVSQKRQRTVQDLNLNCGHPAPRAAVVAVSTRPL